MKNYIKNIIAVISYFIMILRYYKSQVSPKTLTRIVRKYDNQIFHITEDIIHRKIYWDNEEEYYVVKSHYGNHKPYTGYMRVLDFNSSVFIEDIIEIDED